MEKSVPGRVKAILAGMGMASVDAFALEMKDLLGAKESVSAEEMAKYVSLAMKAKNIANCIVVPGEKDLLDVFKASFEG